MIKRIIYTLFTKGFTAGVNFLILILSSKMLGVDTRGQISLLVLNIAVIQIINEIFTGYSLVHFIPKTALRGLYRAGLLWTLAVTTLLNLAFYLFSADIPGYGMAIYALSFIIILHTFNMVILLAKENIRIYNLLSFAQPFLLLLSLIVLIMVFHIETLDSYILALYISFSLPLLFSIGTVLTYISREESTLQPLIGFGKIISNGFYNQLANLTHMLSNRLNYYLLSSTFLVGLYSTAGSLIEALWIVGNSITPIVLTRIANTGDTSDNRQIVLTLSKLSLIISCLLVVVLFFLPNALFIYILGDKFSEVRHLMLLLSPGILAVSFSTIISHYFSGLGMQRQIAIANGGGMVVAIATAPWLIARYGLEGSTLSANCSYFCSSVILLVMFLHKTKLGWAGLFNFQKDKAALLKARN